ncbi:MAG: hypothetical protein CL878_08360 [Dehalococcoidia bacterium]|nr:hypothetical protein [Dehalococcoidia bacterium]
MLDGRLLFARYAFKPNQLGLCGGQEAAALLDYCIEGHADDGLGQLIPQFQAAYPYLQFIAHANGIANPQDPRVVEAYWLGNELLKRVDMREFYRFIEERFGQRLPPRLQKYVLSKVPQGARPHHSFHVLDVSIRTGALATEVESLDQCRISWGSVARTTGDRAGIIFQPLVWQNGRLSLGQPTERVVSCKVAGKGYLTNLRPGDLVSMHWNWLCDRLTPRQARRLSSLTEHHITLANQTI